MHRTIEHIHQLGAKAGVVINPATPISAVEEILADIDQLLIMTVNPGFGGQKFIEQSVDKITRAARLRDRLGSTAEIEVDGGIDQHTAPRVVAAGASILVAGSAIFNHPAGITAAIRELRQSVE